MNKRSKETIYPGDIIEIINPMIITRIGYDYTYEQACKEILDTYGDDISLLLRKAHFKLNLLNNHSWDKAEKKIVGALAYDLVKKKIKNGNERKIYTELKENLRGQKFEVLSKKTTKTGIYYPAVSSVPSGEYGDYDYEPGGLHEPKTHIILEIDHIGYLTDKPIMIERINVKRIIENEMP